MSRRQDPNSDEQPILTPRGTEVPRTLAGAGIQAPSTGVRPSAIPEEDPPTRRAPAATARISRFEDAGEPNLNVAEILERDLLEETITERYRTVSVLGRGGMGEVTRSLDTKIGREVALKTMRMSGTRSGRAASANEQSDVDGRTSSATTRFLREARIQALLEHPAIVPVYDIATAENGEAPFFTMKRVRGQTLHELLHASRDGSAAAGTQEGKARPLSKTAQSNVVVAQHRLLSAFVTVCLAMHYAHERGVVHRDLKPDNIMLGAHGEVYVLDWGVAKVLQSNAPASARLSNLPAAAYLPTPTAEEAGEATRYGDMVGTPGYMSPEQVLGHHDLVSPKSDIFSLGTILYELLAKRPFFTGGDTQQILVATLDSHRAAPPPAGDVPPELYALCVSATRFQQHERISSAREMAERIERFLDGDRDVVLRAKLADQHAKHAAELRAIAFTGKPAEREHARARAMREGGRALALMPEHKAASDVIIHLLGTPPEMIPEGARKETAALRESQIVASLRDNVMRVALWAALFPLLFLMGIRTNWLAAVAFGLLAMNFGGAILLWRMRITSSAIRLAGFILSATFTAALTGAFGPLVFVPGFAAVNTILFTAQASKRHRLFVITVGSLAIAAPLALELLGVIEPSMAFEDGVLKILPRLSQISASVSLIALTVVSLIGVVVPSLIAGRLRDALLAAEERLTLQKWHLAQLAPAPLSKD